MSHTWFHIIPSFLLLLYVYFLVLSIFPFSPDRLVFFLFLFGSSDPQPSGPHRNPGCFPRGVSFSVLSTDFLPLGEGKEGRNGAGGAVPSFLPWRGQKQAHPGQGHTPLPRTAPTPLLTYSLNLKGLKAANCILEFPSGAFCELAMQETKNYRKT